MSATPTPSDLAAAYNRGHDELTALGERLPDWVRGDWANILGALRRVPGQPYHREPPRGLDGERREDPLTDEERRVLLFRINSLVRRVSSAAQATD